MPMADSWWLTSREGFTKQCEAHFDVRLSRKLGKALTPHQNEAAAHKLAKFRSGQATVARAGIKRAGFGVGTKEGAQHYDRSGHTGTDEAQGPRADRL